LEKSFHLAAQ